MTTKSTATRIINKSNNDNGVESFGFKRYSALPNKSRLNLAIAHWKGGMPDDTFIQTVVSFFSEMTEIEYRNWIMVNV